MSINIRFKMQGLVSTYLLKTFPPTRAPMALPKGAGTTCRAAIAFEAFSVLAKKVARFDTICFRTRE